MANIYDVMKGYKILIVDSGFTKKQRFTLVSLGFKAGNSLPAIWTYKAMDTPDLVDVTEDLELSKYLKGMPYKIKEDFKR